MKIATWNVNSVRARLERVLAWLQKAQPDILCLQELKTRDDAFPREAIREAGYHAAVYGQRTFNGVSILSRIEQQNVLRSMEEDVANAQARFLAAQVGEIHVIGALHSQRPSRRLGTVRLQAVRSCASDRGFPLKPGSVPPPDNCWQPRQARRFTKPLTEEGEKTMARTDGDKTKAVREYLQQHRKAKSNEVVEALKAQGITVSTSLVRNIKSKSKRRRRAVKQVVAAVAPTGIGVPEIKAALTFLKTVGPRGDCEAGDCGGGGDREDCLAGESRPKAEPEKPRLSRPQGISTHGRHCSDCPRSGQPTACQQTPTDGSCLLSGHATTFS